MPSSALFSVDRNYRYALTRVWDESLPRVTWVLLNPSRANEHEDDPTIRRVVGLSRSWGFGSVLVANLYARVCTCPTKLREQYDEKERIGPRNDALLSRLDSPIVVAWGAHAYAQDRAQEVLTKLPQPLFCISQNQNGSPKHPLYARSDSQLINFLP